MGAEAIGLVLSRLKNFESMTWREIDGNTGSHGVSLSSLSKEARDRLEEIRQDDAPELFSLRITGAARVWGILDEEVFRVLWWDPNHQVCPSIKKHT